MGYTHYWNFNIERGQTASLEKSYQRAIADCQRIVKAYYREHGGLSGYTAHCKLGQYAGLQVNGAFGDGCEEFSLREHLSENHADFCKTRQNPYDIVVVACLAVLKHRLGVAMNVSSDGRPADWTAGIDLARRVTGLKIKNPIKERI